MTMCTVLVSWPSCPQPPQKRKVSCATISSPCKPTWWTCSGAPSTSARIPRLRGHSRFSLMRTRSQQSSKISLTKVGKFSKLQKVTYFYFKHVFQTSFTYIYGWFSSSYTNMYFQGKTSQNRVRFLRRSGTWTLTASTTARELMGMSSAS